MFCKDSRAVVGMSARLSVSVSVGVGVTGPVKDPNCSREETVHVAGGFGPDGLQPPARGESLRKSVTGMGEVGHNPTCTPQSPGAVQVLKAWLQPITFSAEYMICCSLLLSLEVAAAYQTVMEEVRMDSMMAEYKCTIIVFGRLNFFSCCRKNILYCAFLVRDLMFSSHFRSWVMMVPRKWQDSIELTGEPHRMMGTGGAGLFLKSTTISSLFKALSSRLFWLHRITRWPISHL